eukprot:GHVQ01008408.1.p2 GENE.GHVQ01008408.1~~GHVQ01008408.1.p2  ORF type:complete len:273 (+),score=23.30 GHVQ01008408.1:423-1241(+)
MEGGGSQNVSNGECGNEMLQSAGPYPHANLPMELAHQVVLIDMDNTLVDWDSQFYSLMSRLHPRVPLLSLDKRLNWSIQDNYPSEHESAILALTDEPEFWRTMPPMDGGVDAVKSMAARGLSVYIVSTPDPIHTSRCAKEKFDWIECHLGSKWKSRVILASDKTLIRGDILIDDKPSVCHGSHDPAWIHVLFHHAYNKKETEKPRVIKWDNWWQVLADVVQKRTVYYQIQTERLLEQRKQMSLVQILYLWFLALLSCDLMCTQHVHTALAAI